MRCHSLCARALVAALSFSSACRGAGDCTQESEGAVSGPAPRVLAREPDATNVAQLNASECGRCHQRAYQAWQTSAHHRSHNNPLFDRELARVSDKAWCSSCHAPSAVAVDVAREEHLREGIGCAVCHVRDNQVLSSHVSGNAPHASVTAAIDESAACAGCHQFHFQPGTAHADPTAWLQNTHHEHADSAFAAQSCSTCHLPSDRNADRHALPGHEDPLLLRQALQVEVSCVAHLRPPRAEIRIVLRAGRVGHAIPTGDFFRHLVVSAWSTSDPNRVVKEVLGRRFAERGGLSSARRRIVDTRVPAGGHRDVILVLPGRPRSITWEIELGALPLTDARAVGLPRDRLRWPMAHGGVTTCTEEWPNRAATFSK